MKALYTALIFPKEDGSGFYAKVPDIAGCISSGKTIDEALYYITDALHECLLVLEDEQATIPTPSPYKSFVPSNGEIYTLIPVDTLAFRKNTDTHAVRKNVSIPAWMDYQAKKMGLNLSQTLQDALQSLFV